MVYQLIGNLENTILGTQQAFEQIVTKSQNFNTDGFKSNRLVFSQMFEQEMNGVPRYSGRNRQVYRNKYSQAGSTSVINLGLDFQQGSIKNLGADSPLSAAITGASLFVVSEGNQRRLTRNSSWTFNQDGELLDVAGRQVMGFRFNNGVLDRSQLVPIKIDISDPEQLDSGFEENGILNSNYQLRTNGVNAPKTPLFQLGLAVVPNNSGLESINGTAFRVTRNSGQISDLGISGESGFGTVTGSAVEQSTVDPATLSVEGVQLQRQFQILQTGLTLISKALDTLIQTTSKASGT